jgi:hypothetical protein
MVCGIGVFYTPQACSFPFFLRGETGDVLLRTGVVKAQLLKPVLFFFAEIAALNRAIPLSDGRYGWAPIGPTDMTINIALNLVTVHVAPDRLLHRGPYRPATGS